MRWSWKTAKDAWSRLLVPDREWRLREGSTLAQGHTAGLSRAGFSAPRFMLPLRCPKFSGTRHPCIHPSQKAVGEAGSRGGRKEELSTETGIETSFLLLEASCLELESSQKPQMDEGSVKGDPSPTMSPGFTQGDWFYG